jgi:hypothetical protein
MVLHERLHLLNKRHKKDNIFSADFDGSTGPIMSAITIKTPNEPMKENMIVTSSICANLMKKTTSQNNIMNATKHVVIAEPITEGPIYMRAY